LYSSSSNDELKEDWIGRAYGMHTQNLQFSIHVIFVGRERASPQPALQPLGRYTRNAVWFGQSGEVADKII
jgi:hypothetical protein